MDSVGQGLKHRADMPVIVIVMNIMVQDQRSLAEKVANLWAAPESVGICTAKSSVIYRRGCIVYGNQVLEMQVKEWRSL